MNSQETSETDYIPKNGGVIKLPLFRMGGTAIAIMSLVAVWNYFVPSKMVVETVAAQVADLSKRVNDDHDTMTDMKREIDDMYRWMEQGKNRPTP